MPKDSISSHYKGTSGEDYAKGRKQEVLNHLGYQLQKKFFLPYLNETMHVLDFGCGNGSMAAAIKPHVASISGVEVNASPRALAREKQQISVYEGLDFLPKAMKYDAIISNHVLEHIPNVIATLKIIRNHLSPGGQFITMLPIEDWRTKNNQKWQPDELHHHLHTWTPLLFGNTLSEAGFTPLTLKVITHAWTPKLFFLGDNTMQSIACYLLSAYLKRRQLFAVATPQ